MNETTSLIPIDIIEDGTQVTLTFDNTLHKRLQNLIFKGLPFKDMTHFLEVTKQVKNGDYKSDPLAPHLFTILYITSMFEEEARKQGKIIKKQFDPISKTIVSA